MSVFDYHCAAVVIVFQLEKETKLKGVDIFVFTIEVPIAFLKGSFKSLQFGGDNTCLLEVDIEFIGLTAGLQFFIGSLQFFVCVATEAGPVEDNAHVTGLDFVIIFLLFAGRAHRLIEILPFGEFQEYTSRLEYAVKIAEEIGKLKTFFFHFL
jgi:hypothetical protein